MATLGAVLSDGDGENAAVRPRERHVSAIVQGAAGRAGARVKR